MPEAWLSACEVVVDSSPTDVNVKFLLVLIHWKPICKAAEHHVVRVYMIPRRVGSASDI